jgi:hypothetical protein
VIDFTGNFDLSAHLLRAQPGLIQGMVVFDAGGSFALKRREKRVQCGRHGGTSVSQARRRGFELRLPLHLFNKLQRTVD